MLRRQNFIRKGQKFPLSDQNNTTLLAYSENVEAYLAHTPQDYGYTHRPLLRWMDGCIDRVPKGGKIFEIGSATGREAQYLRTGGAEVICTDAVQGFVDHLRAVNENAFLFNILKDPIEGQFDMFFANAVVPHFTPQDFHLSLVKIREALKPEGFFAFSAKQGSGEEWIREKMDSTRYIRYWKPEQLWDLATETGFRVVYLESDTRGSLPTHIWTHTIFQKIDS
jgi:SAM-dependent methyltransferase